MKEVLEEVAREEWVMHDVFGCADCFVDPHNGHIPYCLLSVYVQPFPSFSYFSGWCSLFM